MFVDPVSRLSTPPPVAGSGADKSPQVDRQGRLWGPSDFNDGIYFSVRHLRVTGLFSLRRFEQDPLNWAFCNSDLSLLFLPHF